MGQKIQTTVIIPNYNGIRYLEKCLSSLIKEPAAVIMVDNGSTDGSLELAEQKFPQVQLIRLKRNYGFCKAVNIGIENSHTKYVILLNNDTEVEEGFVRALEAPLDRDKRIFSCSAQMLNMHRPELIDDAGDYYCALGWAFANGKDKAKSGYQRGYEVFAACGGAAIYRRSVFYKIGYLDEAHFAYLEDIDLGYRARIYGYRNLYEPGAVVYHAGSASSGSRYNSFKVELASKNSVYLIYKNMPFLQIFLNLPFLLAGFLIKGLFFIKKGFGKEYLTGLKKGLRICISKEARGKKVRFQADRLANYVVIQLELWRNLLYRLR